MCRERYEGKVNNEHVGGHLICLRWQLVDHFFGLVNDALTDSQVEKGSM